MLHSECFGVEERINIIALHHISLVLYTKKKICEVHRLKNVKCKNDERDFVPNAKLMD